MTDLPGVTGEQLSKTLHLLGVGEDDQGRAPTNIDEWLAALEHSPRVVWFDWRTSPEAALEALCQRGGKDVYLDFEEKDGACELWREVDGERISVVTIAPWPPAALDPVVTAACEVLRNGTVALAVVALDGSDSSAYAFVSRDDTIALEQVLGVDLPRIFRRVKDGTAQ